MRHDISPDEHRELIRLGNLDPRLAYGLALCGSDEQSFGGSVELTGASLNVPTPITFQQIPNNCYIRDFTYDLFMPNYGGGNLLAPQAAHFLALHPGVDLKIQINQGWGPLNQVLNQDFQPIQHLVRNTAAPSPSCCDWLKGKFVWAWQSFTAAVLLKRALTEGESPYIITFGLKVNALPFRPTEYNFDEAVAGLSGMGINLEKSRVDRLRASLGIR